MPLPLNGTDRARGLETAARSQVPANSAWTTALRIGKSGRIRGTKDPRDCVNNPGA